MPFGTTNIAPTDTWTAPSRKIDPQNAIQHNESLVRILVIVPNEVALQLHDLELVVVHFGDDLRLPLLAEQRELFAEVDRLVPHVVAPSIGCVIILLSMIVGPSA